jgi:hypothetical protein
MVKSADGTFSANVCTIAKEQISLHTSSTKVVVTMMNKEYKHEILQPFNTSYPRGHCDKHERNFAAANAAIAVPCRQNEYNYIYP